jgi:hypothetical protein
MSWKEIKSEADIPIDSTVYWVTTISPFGGRYVYLAQYIPHEAVWIEPESGIRFSPDNVIAYQEYYKPEPFKDDKV